MIWWCLFLFIVGAVITLNTHELSHAVVVWWTGGTIKEYAPYPHEKNGRYFFGRVLVQYNGLIPQAYHYSHIAPHIKALFLLALWLPLAILVHTPLWILAAWEVLDILTWWEGYFFSEATDGWKWRHRNDTD